ncbi:MAG: hypothetical protein ABF723_14285, partial [Lentilactobacillus hilgardii]|uniref:hypothetical protein n=1 Tax=Lentilactobacillus hilgardii TaxID=1588 RepID=UPI0039E77708
ILIIFQLEIAQAVTDPVRVYFQLISFVKGRVDFMVLSKQLEMTVFGQLVTGLKPRQRLKRLQKKLQREKGQATAVAAS